MAGLGYKLFTAGEVLTAANVNGYLMQGVMVFDDSTARSSALGTAVAEGMVSYLKDTDSTEVYDGSSWAGIATGDITAVTAGIGLTGGGSSGDVTLNVQATLTSSTATSYALGTADIGTYIQMTNAGTVTISTATAFTAGQQVQILADGTALTIAGDGNVTLAGAGTAGTAVSFTVGNQYEAVAIVGVGSDAYRIIGNVTGA